MTPAKPSTIHERMIAILGALPPIGKTQKNTQQNFMFRGQDDVLNALNPLLASHGVFVVPDVVERVTDQRTTSGGKIMFEVNLHVRFTFYGAAGDSVTGSAWGEGTDMGDKATNKAMTMAFKYVLNQVFAISTAETPDSDRETPEHSTQRGRTPDSRKAPVNVNPDTGEISNPDVLAQANTVRAGIVRLAPTHPEWKLEAVIAGAAKRFGRPVAALEDLTADELGQIAAAMPKEDA